MVANIAATGTSNTLPYGSKSITGVNFSEGIEINHPKLLSPVKLFSKNQIQNQRKSQILIEKIQSQLPLSKESLKARTNES